MDDDVQLIDLLLGQQAHWLDSGIVVIFTAGLINVELFTGDWLMGSVVEPELKSVSGSFGSGYGLRIRLK